jgi:hypothetical protein
VAVKHLVSDHSEHEMHQIFTYENLISFSFKYILINVASFLDAIFKENVVQYFSPN